MAADIVLPIVGLMAFVLSFSIFLKFTDAIIVVLFKPTKYSIIIV